MVARATTLNQLSRFMVARATTLNQASFTHPPPSFVLMAWAIKNSQRCFRVMA